MSGNYLGFGLPQPSDVDPNNPMAYDAADFWRRNAADTWAAMRNPQTWIDAARHYGNALLMGSVAPGSRIKAAATDPYDFTNRYNTQLTPAEEQAYQAWGRQQAAQRPDGRNPAQDTYDYDMRGFWKSGGDFAPNGHAGDTYKKPNHPTFSTFSQYHGVDGNEGGVWAGGQNGQPWTFTPGATNLKVHDVGDLQRYFSQVEQGNQLIVPDAR